MLFSKHEIRHFSCLLFGLKAAIESTISDDDKLKIDRPEPGLGFFCTKTLQELESAQCYVYLCKMGSGKIAYAEIFRNVLIIRHIVQKRFPQARAYPPGFHTHPGASLMLDGKAL